MESTTLSGFEAILDTIIPGKTDKNEDIEVKEDITEELTDEELEQIKKGKGKQSKSNIDDTKDNDEDEKETEEDKTEEDDIIDDDNYEQSTDEDDTVSNESDSEIVTGFFNALSEKLGWDDVEEDKKPKTAEQLIEYFYDVIEENSKPEYASEEVEALDKFVKQGGNLKDYLKIDADLDLDNIEIEDDESIQKLVLKEFLKEKGFNAKQIEKKLTKYEDAGLLEDEATDALESLKDIREEKKKQLLAQQEKQYAKYQEDQRAFFNNVVDEIKGMDSIYGVKIPEKDKKVLLDYIFKPDADGMTKYRKDYAKSLKNLIASAYFTMKGDDLISIAKNEGKRDAFTQFKNSLNKNSGISKKSKTQAKNNDSDTIWSSFTRRLRNTQ